MCEPNTNLLLRGSDGKFLADYICSNFDNTQIVRLFILISKELDVTTAKYKVYKKVYVDLSFLSRNYKAIMAAQLLQQKFTGSNLIASSNVKSIKELYNKFMDIKWTE